MDSLRQPFVAPSFQRPRLETKLLRPHPNPCGPRTEIPYVLARSQRVRVGVYALDGRRVALLVDGLGAPGPASRMWDGRDENGRAAASGVYIVRLETESRTATRKLVLAR